MAKDLRVSNIKGVLIFLVVFGHFIEIYRKEYEELFIFIYAFHMPLFIFISGYLAKRMRLSKIINLILLYLIFQTVFSYILYLVGEFPLQFTYGRPHFHLWYIVSLGFWYGIVWLVLKFRLNKILIFVLLTSISFFSRWYIDDVVEFVEIFYENFTTYTLSVQRTLSFLPFFFLGFIMNAEVFNKVCHVFKNKFLLLITIAIGVFFTFYLAIEVDGMRSLFRGSFGKHKFMEDDDPFSYYVFLIGMIYSLSLVLSFLLMNVVSAKESILTKWGDHSLTVFLFHPIFIFVLRETEFMDDWTILLKLSFYFILAVIVTALLSHKAFIKGTKWLCSPYQAIKEFFAHPSLNNFYKKNEQTNYRVSKNN